MVEPRPPSFSIVIHRWALGDLDPCRPIRRLSSIRSTRPAFPEDTTMNDFFATSRSMSAALLTAAVVATPAAAEFTGWMFDHYASSDQEFFVVDVYAQFDDQMDTVLSVFNAQIGTAAGMAFHHDDFRTLSGLPGAWNVKDSGDIPGVVDSSIDSFVMIGGPIGGINTTALDDQFVPGTGGAVPENAGWFNANPSNLQGRAEEWTWRLWVGRFVRDLVWGDGLILSFGANLSYDQGPGTSLQYGWDGGKGSGPITNIYIPAPSVAAVLLIGGAVVGRRRSRTACG
jgi:hypothetical protein